MKIVKKEKNSLKSQANEIKRYSKKEDIFLSQKEKKARNLSK